MGFVELWKDLGFDSGVYGGGGRISWWRSRVDPKFTINTLTKELWEGELGAEEVGRPVGYES